jgi:hypothetical protein
VVTRQVAADAAVLRPAVEACLATCRTCREECERHAEHHEHCRICAQVGGACAPACGELLASLG